MNNLRGDNGSATTELEPIGSILCDRYQILERLGTEGAVTAYIAIDMQIPGSLQLKCVLHRYALADDRPESLERQQAIALAENWYALSRRVDRLPLVYSYFIEDRALYIAREYIAGVPLRSELGGDSAEPTLRERQAWTQAQILALLADLLGILQEIERDGSLPAIPTLAQIVRRHLDRQLTIVGLPLAAESGQIAPILRQVGEIAIAVAIGKSECNPLTAEEIELWQSRAPQIDRPEVITIIERLLAENAERQYLSIAAAWQAVVAAIPQLLVRQYSRAETRAELARHVQQSIARGHEFYELGHCQQALAAYDRAISLDPDCFEAYCGRGNTRRFIGDYDGSWADFDRAIALDPSQGMAYVGRGLAASFAARADSDPLADFQRGRELLAEPTTALEYVMRGTASAQLGDARAAIEDYTSGIGLNPRLVIAYNNRGNLLQHLGNLTGALSDFSKVLEIDPHSAVAYNNRAIIYTHIGRFTDAINDYKQAIDLQPDFISVYNNLGNTYCQMDENKLAIERYSQAIEIDPDFAVAYSNRANIYRIEGNLQGALSDYDRAIELDPRLIIAYYNRGICHRQLGNHQQAIDNYTQALNLDRQYFHAYYHRGNARQYLGDKHGAIADYTQTIFFESNHLQAYYNRAVVRTEIGDFDGAMDDLDRVLAIQPQFALAYYQRGRLFAMNDEHHHALAAYQKSLDLQPDYRDGYYQRGCSYLHRADTTAALRDFDRTIEIDANYAPAYYQRGKIYAQLGDRDGALNSYNRAANLYLDRGDSKTYQQILHIIDRLISTPT